MEIQLSCERIKDNHRSRERDFLFRKVKMDKVSVHFIESHNSLLRKKPLKIIYPTSSNFHN